MTGFALVRKETLMTTAATASPATDLDQLGAQLTGTIALPGDDGCALATPFNVAVPVAPRAVVAVADAADVATTVRFAAAHGLRVIVQRTGHGAVAFDGEDVLLVHTGALDTLRIDPSGRTALVGAGIVWQQVIDAAAPFGLAPVCGSAPGVGVVGMLTGGGVGPLVRTLGLSSDWVRAFDVVTGDGELRHVTPRTGGELFWGLRGGKSTLGIVVAVEIEMPAIEEIHGGAIYYDGVDAAAVLRRFARWAPTLPEYANTSLAFLQMPALPQVPPLLAGRFAVAVRFASPEQADVCDALLAPMREVATPLIDTVGPMPYTAIGAIHADPVDPMPIHESSALLAELDEGAVGALLAVAGPEAGSPQVIVELRLLGGAMARESAHPSAFCHRDAKFSVLTIGVLAPDIADAVVGHAGVLSAALAPYATGGVLPNFAPAARGVRRYDDDTRAWLIALGDRFDPDGVLRVGQVVRS